MTQHSLRSLFLTGFTQVFFVSMSTYCIAQRWWVGMMISSFAVSYVWTINVTKVKAATTRERITYSCGAALGTVVGVLTVIFLKNLNQK